MATAVEEDIGNLERYIQAPPPGLERKSKHETPSGRAVAEFNLALDQFFSVSRAEVDVETASKP